MDGSKSASWTTPISSETKALAKGAVLQGRYEILGLRALGGMGAVYEARDLRFTHTFRRCAVKEIINTVSDLQTQRLNLQNFEREANILASLNHPAIPHIFDYFGEDDRAYLVLEYIDGEDLESFLERTTEWISERRALHWAWQVCNVLEYLHGHQAGPIVFRDMKPSNIMLCSEDRIMLVDFGIAKVFIGGQKETMVGTEGYAPPEQYRGLVGPRGDLYALGATLHHLLTRQDPRREPPFSFHERLPRLVNPAISPETEALVMKAVEYDVEKRFVSAAEMKRAIESVLSKDRAKIAESTAGPFPGSRPEVSAVWEFACEDEIRSSPVVHNGVLYIGSYDKNLYALEAKSGRQLWKYPTEGGICSSPSLSKDKLFFGSEDRVFYALSPRTGRVIWTCPTDGRIRSSALAEYGHVFFGSDDGNLYAVNESSARLIWKFHTDGPIRCRPLLSGEAIVFGSEDGQVYGVDMGTGELRWKQRTSQGVISSPCLGEGLIFIGSRDWYLYALNARSGWPVWRFRTTGPVISSPAVADKRVFFGSADGYVYALDAQTGRLVWKYATEGQVTSSPCVHNGAIYIGSVDGYLYCLDAKSGQRLWRFRTDGPLPSSPMVAEDLVYVGSMDGRVYAWPL